MPDFGTYYSDCGTIASDMDVSNLTTEKILAACGVHYIEVPRTPLVFGLDSLPEVPPLHKADLCDSGQAYILAGFGVIAGKETYDRLSGHLFTKWVDSFPDD